MLSSAGKNLPSQRVNSEEQQEKWKEEHSRKSLTALGSLPVDHKEGLSGLCTVSAENDALHTLQAGTQVLRCRLTDALPGGLALAPVTNRSRLFPPGPFSLTFLPADFWE